MTAWAIIDTGPLVAYLSGGEPANPWAADQFKSATEPFATCEAVITEALFILRRDAIAHGNLFALLARGAVRLDFDLADHRDDVCDLMTRYADVPMSLADACLVRMAELNPRAEIITLDRRFKFYRTRDRRVPRLRLPPSASSG